MIAVGALLLSCLQGRGEDEVRVASRAEGAAEERDCRGGGEIGVNEEKLAEFNKAARMFAEVFFRMGGWTKEEVSYFMEKLKVEKKNREAWEKKLKARKKEGEKGRFE